MNIGKIIFGLIMLLAGIWLLVPVSFCNNLIYCPGLWKELFYVLKGIVPVGLVILGVILIWIETE